MYIRGKKKLSRKTGISISNFTRLLNDRSVGMAGISAYRLAKYFGLSMKDFMARFQAGCLVNEGGAYTEVIDWYYDLCDEFPSPAVIESCQLVAELNNPEDGDEIYEAAHKIDGAGRDFFVGRDGKLYCAVLPV